MKIFLLLPVFDESKEPVLVREKLSNILATAKKETDFLVLILNDPQVAADKGWSRVQASLLILRYSLATKLIYFAQTIDPQLVAPYAAEFDQLMRETFLHLIDVERISEHQALQVSLPLKDGGCGLRTHTISELRRFFVSSAMLIAPAVEAATGFRVGERPDVDDLAAEISPFDACLEVCASHLENDLGISRPDFSRAGPLRRLLCSDSSRRLGVFCFQENCSKEQRRSERLVYRLAATRM